MKELRQCNRPDNPSEAVMAGLVTAIHVFRSYSVIPGRCEASSPESISTGIPGGMDSGLALRAPRNDGYVRFSTDTKNPSVPVWRGVIRSPSAD